MVFFTVLSLAMPRRPGPPNFISEYDRYNVYVLEYAKTFGGPGRLGIAKVHMVVFAQLGN